MNSLSQRFPFPSQPWKYLLIGGATGLLSGFFGVGGGIVLIPLLIFLLKLEQHRAHATSLAAIFIVAGAGLIRFAVAGEVNWGVGLALGLGGLFGSTFGARTMQRMSPLVLRFVFSGVLTVVGVAMIFRPTDYTSDTNNTGLFTLLVAILIGFGSGIISGMIGLGGGVVLVPAMVLLLGIDQHLAQGTALFVMLFSTSAGTRIHIRHRRLNLGDSLLLGIGGAIISPLAGSLALALEPGTLTRLFGIMVVYTGGRMGWSSFRSLSQEARMGKIKPGV